MIGALIITALCSGGAVFLACRGTAKLYRHRWLTATKLLNEREAGEATGTKAAGTNARAWSPSLRATGMNSWDRRDLEVMRAEQGLAPADDLAGMESWDKRDVLEARAKAEKRLEEQR